MYSHAKSYSTAHSLATNPEGNRWSQLLQAWRNPKGKKKRDKDEYRFENSIGCKKIYVGVANVNSEEKD